MSSSTPRRAGAAAAAQQLAAYHRAGPRREVAFDPVRVRAAIVTCGGLCPGMNTVVGELVRRALGALRLCAGGGVFGVRNGYGGFYSEEEPSRSSRRRWNSGTRPAGQCSARRAAGSTSAGSWAHRAARRKQAIAAGHVEAESAVNGVGLVKLMGRSTGHIALHATLSSRDVDCCLIPEENFYLRGAGGLFEFLYQPHQKERAHAVVVVAEGAGQGLIPTNTDAPRRDDESGNPAFLDVGAWLKAELKAWWEEEHAGELFTVKYIDPTYMIRAVPANAEDNLYCTLLAHSAIHGVMAGYTGFVSGLRHQRQLRYIPMAEVAEGKNPVDTKDHKWAWVRSITNQPRLHPRPAPGAGATS
ncbi:hypothetical protein GUJ93_ZPchr0009g1955 [Zizania palustris]|uniref:Phosphofructokinase domain-containing protein n=1 Tax=Zizania palustris TaxID=103762 RepID=A0A8J5RMB9_ZIZPA|nr:hypothetical protein GUJ93_ZPchr0009g1955 [Zizania palustris]